MATAAYQQDAGLSSGIVSSKNLVYPGGIQIGNIHATAGKISHPTLVSKAATGDVAASELVNSLIVVSGNAGAATLTLPTVEAILAAFAAQSRVFSVGDQFEVDIVKSAIGAGDVILALAFVGGQHSLTWASGVVPVHLTQAGPTNTHAVRLIFEVTSLTTPAMSVSTIVG